jgi:hypothetical protein
MNQVISLPKDYKELNPHAKKSVYPALTGYTSLHIGKLIKYCFSCKSDINPFFHDSCSNSMCRSY